MKCQCSKDCNEIVKTKGRKYAVGHSPKSHAHPMPHNMTKSIRKKISLTLKKRWRELSDDEKDYTLDALQLGSIEAWKDKRKRRRRIRNMSLGVKKYCRENRALVLKRNRNVERCKKISKGLCAAYESGIKRRPAHGYDARYVTGCYHSSKTDKEVFYRSSWELKLMKALDASKKVIDWDGEGCVTVPYKFENRKRTYFLDFLINFSDGRLLAIEVKPKRKLKEPKIAAKISAAKELCSDVGLPFKVVTNVKKFVRKYL